MSDPFSDPVMAILKCSLSCTYRVMKPYPSDFNNVESFMRGIAESVGIDQAAAVAAAKVIEAARSSMTPDPTSIPKPQNDREVRVIHAAIAAWESSRISAEWKRKR